MNRDCVIASLIVIIVQRAYRILAKMQKPIYRTQQYGNPTNE